MSQPGSDLLPEQASVNTRILVADKVHSAAATPSGVEPLRRHIPAVSLRSTAG